MAKFVLIHGAFAGGWCWHWVRPFLQEAGHDVYAPSLTGHGERVHLANPQVDLDTHIDDVVNVLHYEDLTDVVLVGWSYGGMVVAGVADRNPERIAHLVYLDSDVPQDGDTSVPHSQHAAREDLAQIHGDGWYVPPAVVGVEKMLDGYVSESHLRWVAERLTPHLGKTWTQPIRLSGAAASIPTTYVRCTVGYNPDDEDTRRQDARIRNESTWRYLELEATHVAPISKPGLVADVLLAVAQASIGDQRDLQSDLPFAD